MAVREEADARSLHLAYHDSLTGLGNRLLFKEQLEDVLRMPWKLRSLSRFCLWTWMASKGSTIPWVIPSVTCF